MKVMISGGGTGGHLYPALAIGRAFRELGAEILYIGSEFGIEKKVMRNDEFDCRLLPVRGLRGGRPTPAPDGTPRGPARNPVRGGPASG